MPGESTPLAQRLMRSLRAVFEALPGVLITFSPLRVRALADSIEKGGGDE